MGGRIGILGSLSICTPNTAPTAEQNQLWELGIIDGTKEDRNVKVEKHGAFTLTYDEHLNSMAFIMQDQEYPIVLHSARWDTGSEYTYISIHKAADLNADKYKTRSATGIDGKTHKGKLYTVTVELPGGIRISNVDIGELDLSMMRECDAIIGMDLIKQGKLTVDKDRFSFEI